MTRLLIINLFVSLLWPTLNGQYTLGELFFGFLLGFVVLSVVKRSYGRYFFHAAGFLFYVLYAILQSNLKLAWLVMRAIVNSRTNLQPGIVAVPLTITDPFERTLLASVITLTPGTLSMDLGRRDGQDVLFVHTVDLHDTGAFIREIQESFESRILYLHQLQADLADDGDLPAADLSTGKRPKAEGGMPE